MSKQFRNFENARKFVHSLNLKNIEDWRRFIKSGKKPKDIPSNLDGYYKKEWKGWGDFLGTGTIASRDLTFRSFSLARKFVHSIKLQNHKEWEAYLKSGKKPSDIPSHPQRTYKNKGWISWGDFLGTGKIASQKIQFRTYDQAKKFVHSLKLKNEYEWRKFIKSGNKPNDIPSSPAQNYKYLGWTSMGEWLGTGIIAPRNRKYLLFEESRIFVQSLELKNNLEWNEYCKSGKKPDNIPASPNSYYKNKGWTTWGDWLGTGIIGNTTKSQNWLSWIDAKPLYQKIVKENNIKNLKEWTEYLKTHKLPKGLTPYPNQVYTKERVGKMMK